MELVAYITDEDTANVVQEMIDTHWDNRGVVISGGSRAAIASFNPRMEQPQIFIVDISDGDDELDAAKRILNTFQSVPVLILVGQRNDISFYRQVIAAGASDYLAVPFTGNDLHTAITNARDVPEPVVPAANANKRARLFVMMGAHGGAGTSTITVNTGWILAEGHKKSTVLIDLDVHFGTLALALNIDPSVGFRDALESPSRIDLEFLESALVAKTERLAVLSAEENLDDYVVFNGPAIELLIETLREHRSYIFVDAPRAVLHRCPQIVERADKVLLVSELTVTGLRDTLKIQHEMERSFPDTQLQVIVNKRRGPNSGEIALADFEEQLGQKVIAEIPFDDNLVLKAVNEGLPIPALKKNCRLTDALESLCATLTGTGSPAAKPGTLIGKIGQIKQSLPLKARK